jgi:hypothetical protein
VSAKGIAAYQAHREAQGLPRTQPPPAIGAAITRQARNLHRLGRHVLATANESDPVAARALRRIGAGILSDSYSLELVAAGRES